MICSTFDKKSVQYSTFFGFSRIIEHLLLFYGRYILLNNGVNNDIKKLFMINMMIKINQLTCECCCKGNIITTE